MPETIQWFIKVAANLKYNNNNTHNFAFKNIKMINVKW